MKLPYWLRRARRTRDDLDDARSDRAVDDERLRVNDEQAIKDTPAGPDEEAFARVRKQMARSYDDPRPGA